MSTLMDILNTVVEGGMNNGGYLSTSAVLNTPYGTHNISQGTEHPQGTQDVPHIHHESPHSTEHSHST